MADNYLERKMEELRSGQLRGSGAAKGAAAGRTTHTGGGRMTGKMIYL